MERDIAEVGGGAPASSGLPKAGVQPDPMPLYTCSGTDRQELTFVVSERDRGTQDVTVLLQAWQQGDHSALEQLNAAIYQQLREMARRRLAAERGPHTLQPTALVHEAYLRMVDGSRDWRDRAHFFANAALHMRSVLVDHARARLAGKRGGAALRVTLDEHSLGSEATDESHETEFLALDSALRDLQREDERTARIIELSYFSGMNREEIAHVLDVSVPTVDRGLRFGRAWLRQSLAA